jgi:hypothetical protein
VTSVFDSGLFLPNTDPVVCKKLSTIFVAALKFILKCKQPQRACELMQLIMDHAQHLLNTELVSLFAMGMRRSQSVLSVFSKHAVCNDPSQFEFIFMCFLHITA